MRKFSQKYVVGWFKEWNKKTQFIGLDKGEHYNKQCVQQQIDIVLFS